MLRLILSADSSGRARALVMTLKRHQVLCAGVDAGEKQGTWQIRPREVARAALIRRVSGKGHTGFHLLPHSVPPRINLFKPETGGYPDTRA